jgi:DNA repair protein RecO (recombination protein O)
MILEKVEGVVLRSFPYREREHILTLFTLEKGFITLIIKALSKKNTHLFGLTHLFCRGEFLYIKKNSDLYRFSDGTVLNPHLFLRQEWRHLETASKLAKPLLHSQFPGKPAPGLYALFLAYLQQIPFFQETSGFLGSFYLKLLHHEGILRNSEFSSLLAIRSFTQLKEIALHPSQFASIESLVEKSFK